MTFERGNGICGCRHDDSTPVSQATDAHCPGRSCCWQLFTPRRVTNHTPEDEETDMTLLAWANFPFALLFLLAWSCGPLWMVLKRPDTSPDHADAHAYLAAKAAHAEAAEPAPAAA